MLLKYTTSTMIESFNLSNGRDWKVIFIDARNFLEVGDCCGHCMLQVEYHEYRQHMWHEGMFARVYNVDLLQWKRLI